MIWIAISLTILFCLAWGVNADYEDSILLGFLKTLFFAAGFVIIIGAVVSLFYGLNQVGVVK